MRTLLALSVAGVALAGAPSHAAMCAGTAATARVCVNKDVSVTPTGGPVSYSDCIVVGDPENCVPVNVTTPNVVVTGTGSVATVTCEICDEVPEPDLSPVTEMPQRCETALGYWVNDIREGRTPLPGSRVGECVRGD